MPNIRSMTVTRASVTVVSSSGVSGTLTRAQVANHFQNESGTRQERIAATVQWIIGLIRATFPGELTAADIFPEFDDADGSFTRLEILGVLDG